MGHLPLPGFQVQAVHLTNMVLKQRYTPEHHIIISMEVFHELVPAWRMLHSPTSALGHDQTDEHCLSNHMLSGCLVLGSHSYVSTVTDCIKLFLSHSRVWFCAHCTWLLLCTSWSRRSRQCCCLRLLGTTRIETPLHV